MNKGTAVRILDVLIFIAIVLLIYILVQPQFVNYRNQTIEAQIKANAYTVKAAIEHYIADNMGVYPKEVDDFSNGVGSLPCAGNSAQVSHDPCSLADGTFRSSTDRSLTRSPWHGVHR